MTQDEIIAIAIQANIYKKIGGINFNLAMTTEKLTKYTELILASQSEPVARFIEDKTTCGIITLANIENGALLYTKQQPTIQDVIDAGRYRWLRIASNLQIDFITHCFEQVLDDEIDKAMKDSKL